MSRDAVEAVLDGIAVGDFYAPAHQHVWDAICDVYRTAGVVDAVLVGAHLNRQGLLEEIGGPGFLIGLQAITPAISNAPRYAKLVRAAAAARGLIRAGGELAQVGYDYATEPETMFAQAREAIDRAERLYEQGPIKVHTRSLDDLDVAPWTKPVWAIDGMLAMGHILVLAGGGGVGKSSFLRQLLIPTACGFHPFRGTQVKPMPMPARSSLIVDLEGSEDGWRFETIEMGRFWKHQAGIDRLPIRVHLLGRKRYNPVNSRRDKADLLARMAECQPDILVIGPTYKLDQQGGSEWHTGAGKIQDLIGEINDEFGCAVIMESHAGSADALRPRGASDWTFWPELGKTLFRSKKDAMSWTVRNFRGTRYEMLYKWWPRDFVMNTRQLPFRALWDDGMAFPADGDPRPMWDRPPDWADAILPPDPTDPGEEPF